MIRPASADCRLPGAPIAAILLPATPISAACAPVGITAVPPVTTRSSMVPSLPGTVIRVIFPLAAPDTQFGSDCRSRAVQLRMRIESRLVGPALEQCQLVGVEGALKDLELLTAGLLHPLLAASFHHLRELGTLSRRGGDRDDQSYCHLLPLSTLINPGARSRPPQRPASSIAPVRKLASRHALGLNSGSRLGRMRRRLMETRETSNLSGKRQKLLAIIRRASLLQGQEFRLTSGGSSNFITDLKTTMLAPEGASLPADLLFDKLKAEAVDYIGGMETGAIPIVAVLCMRSWPEKPIKGFFVRKEAKGHGTDQRVDGLLDRGSRVILFEDVTTTGSSVMRAVDQTRQFQCTILKVITVVDRLEGAEENFRQAGITFEALFTRHEFS